MTELTKTTETGILSSNEIVIADFWAAWCGPCMMFAPIFQEVAEEMGSKAAFVKVNVDNEPELAMKYGIVSIPTLLAFKNGSVVKKSIGLLGKDEFVRWLSDL